MPGTPASADSGMADRRKTQPSRRSLVTRLAALLVTGLALYVVLPSLSAVLGAWPKLATLSGVWLVLALLFECGSFVCNFAIQRIVLRTRGWFAVVTAGPRATASPTHSRVAPLRARRSSTGCWQPPG